MSVARRWVGRAIGIDVHRDFCEIAICENGVVRSAGRVKSTPEAIRVLAESLLRTDRVALEVSGGAWEVARILEPFVQKVIVVSPEDTGIAQARAKTDRLAVSLACHAGPPSTSFLCARCKSGLPVRTDPWLVLARSKGSTAAGGNGDSCFTVAGDRHYSGRCLLRSSAWAQIATTSSASPRRIADMERATPS